MLGQQVNSKADSKDVEVPSAPNDSVSCLAWSPKANYLVAGSWDNQVRCWEVQQSGQVVPKASINHDGPVLCATWSGDGTQIFSAGCDNKAKCWPLATGVPTQCAQHDAPIKTIAYVDEMSALCTGSWDKTMRYWDGRQQGPALVTQLPERMYCMDILYPLAVVATAERHVLIYDLRKPQVEYKRFQSPLKYQSRCIACFPDKTGFALGSIEGRVAIHHVEDKDNMKNFAFKCHRDGSNIYAVNSISFHPIYGTFATSGSDGMFNFWDKDSKQRLKYFNRCSLPIPCGVFNRDGALYAYAVSYDWSKGSEHHNPHAKNTILIHPTNDQEIKNRGGRKKR
ncbi:Rae1 protein [Balamuthia mandrillaris]